METTAHLTLGPKANVHVQVWDASTPALLDAARRGCGRLIHESRGHNKVVNSGRDRICELLAGESTEGIADFALGTGATAAAGTDTGLEAQVLRSEVSQLLCAALTTTAKFFLSSTQLNGTTIREAGLFTDDDVLIARYILDDPIAKTSAIAVTFCWSITFTGEADVLIIEKGAVKELGGDPNAYAPSTGAYPSGATLDKIVNGSSTWLIDSIELADGEYCLEAHIKCADGATGAPTVGLFDLSGLDPDTPLVGSTVAGIAGDTVGSVVRSGAITFPAPGAAKRLAVKVKSTGGVGAIVWGLSIVKL